MTQLKITIINLLNKTRTQKQSLANLKNMMREEFLTNLGMDIGEQIVKTAKFHVRKWSGALHDSIKIQSFNIIKGNEPEMEIVVGSTLPYAYYQEKGFAMHNISEKIDTYSGYQFGGWLLSKGFVRNGKPYGGMFVGGKKTSFRPYMKIASDLSVKYCLKKAKKEMKTIMNNAKRVGEYVK